MKRRYCLRQSSFTGSEAKARTTELILECLRQTLDCPNQSETTNRLLDVVVRLSLVQREDLSEVAHEHLATLVKVLTSNSSNGKEYAQCTEHAPRYKCTV